MSPRQRAPLTNELILLGILQSKPGYGYDIFRELQTTPGLVMIWRVKQAQLYALLDKLEGQGLLESHIENADPRPARKVYKLTRQGRTVFTEWVASPVGHGRDMRQNFLARLYFAQLAGGDAARILIQRQATVCQEWIVTHQSQMDALKDSQHFEAVIYHYRISSEQAMLAWLKSLLQDPYFNSNREITS